MRSIRPVINESGSLRPGRFGLGSFGQFLGRVVSALLGGSFRPISWVGYFGPGSFRPKSIGTSKELLTFVSKTLPNVFPFS